MLRRVVITIIFCIIALFALLASNPLRRSEASIQRRLLGITPLGTSFSQVEAIVKRRGWGQDIRGTGYGTYIYGDLGHYQTFPYRMWVSVSWDFEGSTNLTSIRVSKSRVSQ